MPLVMAMMSPMRSKTIHENTKRYFYLLVSSMLSNMNIRLNIIRYVTMELENHGGNTFYKIGSSM